MQGVIDMETDLMMLLDTNSRNILSILSVISEKDEWFTIHQISEQLNVVERTIQRYILQLKDCIERFNEGENEKDRLFLHYEKYKGVYLETPKGQGLNLFKQLILEQDETFVMLKQIFFEEFQSVTKYSLDHYISESKVRKSIKKIRQYLKRYHLALSNISFKIVGDEKQIRLLTFYLTWYGFKGTEWPFKQINKEKIDQVVCSLEQVFSMTLTETQKKQLTYMLAINLFRFKRNHIISFEKEWENYVDVQESLKKIPFLQMMFFKNQERMTSEIYFYLLLIQLRINVYHSQQLRECVLEYHQVRQSDVFVVTHHFVRAFHETLIPIPDDFYDAFFITSFCSHLFCKLFRYATLTMDGQAYLTEHQDRYTVLYEQLHQLVDQVYSKTQDTIFLQKRFLIQKYMLLFSMIKPLTHFEPTIGILLESDLPYLTKEMLKRELISRYSGSYHLSFEESYHAESVDLILTNVSNLLESQCYQQNRVYYFTYPLNERDSYELDHHLKEIYKEKYFITD